MTGVQTCALPIWHIHSYTLRDVEALLNKFQFKIVDIYFYYHFMGQFSQFVLYFSKYLREKVLQKRGNGISARTDMSFIAGLKDEYRKGTRGEFDVKNLLRGKYYIKKIYHLFRIFQKLLLVAAYYESKVFKNISFHSSCISARVVHSDSHEYGGR